jgi:hypothetical protein
MHILSLRAQVAALWLAWALAASVAALPGLALRLVRVLAPPLSSLARVLARVLVRFVSLYWFPALVALLSWAAWLIASAMGYIV